MELHNFMQRSCFKDSDFFCSAKNILLHVFSRFTFLLACLVAGCGIVPYPAENDALGLEDKINACQVSMPAMKFPELSSSKLVPHFNQPHNCEVWFLLVPFRKEIGRVEWEVAQIGKSRSSKYAIRRDIINRELSFEATKVFLVGGRSYRIVTTTANLTGTNGTISAVNKSLWMLRVRAWAQVPKKSIPESYFDSDLVSPEESSMPVNLIPERVKKKPDK
jgi:hypothetical protein